MTDEKLTPTEARTRFWKSCLYGAIMAVLTTGMVYWMFTSMVRPEVQWKPHGFAALIGVFAFVGGIGGFSMGWVASTPDRIYDIRKRRYEDGLIARARAIERRREAE